MKKKFYIWIGVLVGILIVFTVAKEITSEYLKQGTTTINSERWSSIIANEINSTKFTVLIDGVEYNSAEGDFYMNENLQLMVPENIIIEAYNCAKNRYEDNKLVVEKGTNRIEMALDDKQVAYNEEIRFVDYATQLIDNRLYVPTDVFTDYLGYSYVWNNDEYTAVFTNEAADDRTLPYYYSYEEMNKGPKVRSQGNFGTCWAFASLTALESTLRPYESAVFSADHMVLCNSFNVGMYDGGDYTMSMAYLLSWQGPVLESQDEYDGVSDENYNVVKHVQEIQIIDSKDYEEIKEMVFKYGGVQSSLYTSLINSSSTSTYYDKEKASYCYIGANKPNHDVVIIGWDDNYPKENFTVDVEGDGAFICRNSWGSEFANEGDFYVSYYDSNIGVHNIVYTSIENTNNYDNIYQADLCGWVGNMGYKDMNSAYFANVYTAKNNETLEAVGFYATDNDTKYEVYVVTDYKNKKSLADLGSKVVEGTLENKGYYTIKLDSPIRLQGGKDYAVVVKATTPNSTKPIAVEFVNDERTSSVKLKDGQGYISLKGKEWEDVEKTKKCNICLKAYTRNN